MRRGRDKVRQHESWQLGLDKWARRFGRVFSLSPMLLVRCEEGCKSEHTRVGMYLRIVQIRVGIPIKLRVVISVNLWAVIYAHKTKHEVDIEAH